MIETKRMSRFLPRVEVDSVAGGFVVGMVAGGESLIVNIERRMESCPLFERAVMSDDERLNEAFRDGFHSELENWACFTESKPKDIEAEKRRLRNRRKRARFLLADIDNGPPWKESGSRAPAFKRSCSSHSRHVQLGQLKAQIEDRSLHIR